MTIEQLKNDLISTLSSMDKDKFSLADLRCYSEIVKTVAEIQTKSYMECLSETMGSFAGFGLSSPTVSELK